MLGTNKTGRLNPEITPPDILGLGTFGLRTCVAVIIVGENSRRISLTHHVGGLERDYSSLLKEIEWVGSPFTIHLTKNTKGMLEGLSEVKTQLNIQTKEDFAKHDTETLIIKFLRDHKLLENLKTRIDTEPGQILVTRGGQLLKVPPAETDLRYTGDEDLRNAIEMMNNVYSKVLLSPCLEFDGQKFLDQTLVQPALYILNLVAYQLKLMNCEINIDNIYIALTKLDALLKGMGSATGARLAVYGQPSTRRDHLLDDIRQIITSGKMPIVEFSKSITDRIDSSFKATSGTTLTH